MKRFAFAAAFALLLGACASANAQVWSVYRPIVGYPAPYPVTSYYAPYGPAPVTAYYAPAPVPYVSYYAPGPVVVGRPAVVPPRYYYPGQPVRNVFRRGVVVW